MDIVLNIDKVVSFLTEKKSPPDSLPPPFSKAKPPPYVRHVVILRTSTHNLFPVLMLIVMHLRGVDWQWCECVCVHVCA